MNTSTAFIVVGALFCVCLQHQVAAQKDRLALGRIMEIVEQCHDSTDPNLDKFAFVGSLTRCVVKDLRNLREFEFIPQELVDALDSEEAREIVNTLDECNEKFRQLENVEQRVRRTGACIAYNLGNQIWADLFGYKARSHSSSA